MTARSLAVVAALTGLALAARPSSAQMPDPRLMSGQVMPSPDLPAGTVTVRIIRQTIMNIVPGVDVELHGAGQIRRATTGPDGHAVFSGVPPGSHVQAVAVVDNERLQSIEFEVPASGGIRTLLAAGVGVGTMLDGSAPAQSSAPVPAGPAGPPPAGTLTFGGDSRIAVEFQDDVLTVFYLLDLVNRTSTPVAPTQPLVIDLPAGASGGTILEGGSPLATVAGSRVTIKGPLPPGITSVPVAFRIEHWDETWHLIQAFPVPLDSVALAVQKLGDMRLASPQAPTGREAALQGTPFLVAMGGRLEAGTPLTAEVSGLPYRSDLPIDLTLALAVGVAAWGVWFATRAPSADTRRAPHRQELEGRRERGLAALAALEAERRDGRLEETRYADRRRVLLDQLERIYGELDGDGGVPGGDRGLAA